VLGAVEEKTALVTRAMAPVQGLPVLPTSWCRRSGGEAVASYDSVAASERFGQVDILINNAGILRDKSCAKMTPEV
jgi:NAD(P)-dependent dehydrogenase (short-subunit alcohol dehydrogenase family)